MSAALPRYRSETSFGLPSAQPISRRYQYGFPLITFLYRLATALGHRIIARSSQGDTPDWCRPGPIPGTHQPIKINLARKLGLATGTHLSPRYRDLTGLEFVCGHVDDFLAVDVDGLGGAGALVAEDGGDPLGRDAHVVHVAAGRMAHLVGVPLAGPGAVFGRLLGRNAGGLDERAEGAAEVGRVDRSAYHGGEHQASLGPRFAGLEPLGGL